MAFRTEDLGAFHLSRNLEFTGDADGLKYTVPEGDHPMFVSLDAEGQVRYAGVVLEGVNEEAGQKLNCVNFYSPSEVLAMVNAREISLARDEDKSLLRSVDENEKKQELEQKREPDEQEHKHERGLGLGR